MSPVSSSGLNGNSETTSELRKQGRDCYSGIWSPGSIGRAKVGPRAANLGVFKLL